MHQGRRNGKSGDPGADVGCDRLLWPDDGFYSSSASLRGARDQRHVSQRKRAVSGAFLRPVSGNVLLRKRQYESLDQEEFCCGFVQNLLYAKIRNAKLVLMRAARNAKKEAEKLHLERGVDQLGELAKKLSQCQDVDAMRGVEGAAATIYFSRFDAMLTANPNGFQFGIRSRRPPRNEVNAALSFVYVLLARETQSALETVGLDPAAGYLHAFAAGQGFVCAGSDGGIAGTAL